MFDSLIKIHFRNVLIFRDSSNYLKILFISGRVQSSFVSIPTNFPTNKLFTHLSTVQLVN